MKKKRIRYSELGAAPADTPVAPQPGPAQEAGAPITDALIVDEAPTEALPVAVELSPTPVRPRRNSTPVELARALAAAQALEAAAADAAAREAFDAVAAAAPEDAKPLPPPTKADLAEVLMFRVGAERFAVELSAVDEVIDVPVIHHVPEMPPAMVGVVSVRGSLTPVYSPHQALGLPLAQSEAVLIFRRAGVRVGGLIDDVEDALSVDLRDLRRAPGVDDHEGVVLGVIRHAGALLAIVDADALIAACQTAALLETA